MLLFIKIYVLTYLLDSRIILSNVDKQVKIGGLNRTIFVKKKIKKHNHDKTRTL